MRYGSSATRKALLVAAATTALAACSDGRARRDAEAAGESAAEVQTAAATAETAQAANTLANTEGAPAVPNAEGTALPAVPATPDLSTPASTAEPAAPPPDIFVVMAAHGYALEGADDLADYLPVPPRSEGQVGRFTREGERVTVARVTYPEAVFADPHEAWIRERMVVVPEANERVSRQGATVVHIRASSAATADAVLEVFGAELRPTEAGDDG